MAPKLPLNGVVVRHALFESKPGFHGCICGEWQYRVFGNDNKLQERFDRHAGVQGLSGRA